MSRKYYNGASFVAFFLLLAFMNFAMAQFDCEMAIDEEICAESSQTPEQEVEALLENLISNPIDPNDLRKRFPRKQERKSWYLYQSNPKFVSKKYHDVVESVLGDDLKYTQARLLLPGTELIWTRIPLTQTKDFDFTIKDFESLLPSQKVNRLPNMIGVNRKDMLARNIQKFMERHPQEDPFHPESFLLPEDHDRILKIASDEPDSKFIVKPIDGGQGRGIHLLSGSNLVQFPLDDSYMIQRYIPDPLLIEGRKHTLRLYVLVTSVNPLRVYLHRKGIVKFATNVFSDRIEDHVTENSMMHLTHPIAPDTFVNATSTKVHHPAGPYRWNIESYNNVLESQGINVSEIWAKIRRAVLNTIFSVEEDLFSGKIHLPFRNGFQILGTDFEIDSKLNVFQLESNLNPSLSAYVSFEGIEKREMILEMFRMVGITRFNSTDVKREIVPKVKNVAKKRNLEFSQEEINVLVEHHYEKMMAGDWEMLFPAKNLQEVSWNTQQFENRSHDRMLMQWMHNL